VLERLKLIRNIGKFDSVVSGQNLPLTKLTLIYAENARGKTTMASILRSMAISNATLITERHRLGAQNPPQVIIKISNNTYTFENGAWSDHFVDIAIFDDHFVAENVCSGIEIDTDHKQKLHELILGAEGVKLNSIVQNQIVIIEDINRTLRENERSIPTNIRGNLSIEAFCALPQNENIDADLQKVNRDLAAATSASKIKQQANFLSFKLPAFDVTSITSILQLDLAGLQAETTATIQRHLAKLGNDGEKWISDGMQRISRNEDNLCPFCDQNLQTSNIITHYENYFSKGYIDHRQAITDRLNAITDDHNSEIQSAFERNISLAVQTREFWKQFMEVPTIEIDTAEIARAWKAAREPILEALQSKLSTPLEKLSLTPEVLALIAAYDSHRENIHEISAALIKCNIDIALVKERAGEANITTLSADLDKLKRTQARYSSQYAPLCQEYIAGKEAKKNAEENRENARKELDLYRSCIFSKYELAINSYLAKFNASFRLAGVDSTNTRGGSTCTYNVCINNIEVPTTANSGPSFKNTLSAGDRNTLALAFFFASLDKDQNLSKKIVIIDDPMTSLDEHRTLATIHEIRDLVKRTSQVIMMSHSKSFLCQIWEGADKNNRTALKITRDGEASTIDSWDVHQDCITEHDKRHALIQEHINASNSAKEREVAMALRPVLEAFLRVAYPAYFPPGTLLGKFHILCTKNIGTMKQILSDADTIELRKLMDYANKFHHDENPAYETVSINDQELVGYCTRTLKFAQKG
jgi:wobble nucleotide-excising tRNase